MEPVTLLKKSREKLKSPVLRVTFIASCVREHLKNNQGAIKVMSSRRITHFSSLFIDIYFWIIFVGCVSPIKILFFYTFHQPTGKVADINWIQRTVNRKNCGKIKIKFQADRHTAAGCDVSVFAVCAKLEPTCENGLIDYKSLLLFWLFRIYSDTHSLALSFFCPP